MSVLDRSCASAVQALLVDVVVVDRRQIVARLSDLGAPKIGVPISLTTNWRDENGHHSAFC